MLRFFKKNVLVDVKAKYFLLNIRLLDVETELVSDVAIALGTETILIG